MTLRKKAFCDAIFLLRDSQKFYLNKDAYFIKINKRLIKINKVTTPLFNYQKKVKRKTFLKNLRTKANETNSN